MKRLVLALLALAAVLAPAALALPGSVTVTSTASDATCNGLSTVTITLDSVAPPAEDVPLDLVIAIDESGSLDATDFSREKQAAIDLINALDFGTAGVRKVGVLAFSMDARVISNLTATKASAISAINGIAQRRGGTNITDAIRDARQMVTNPAQGAQAGAAKVLVLMTDGEANIEVSSLGSVTAAFKSLPGEIFALGFGAADTAQLNMVASDPDSTHVFIAPSATQLSAIAVQIAEQIQNPAATNLVLRASPTAPFSLVAGSVATTAGATDAGVPGGFRWLLPTLDGTQTVTFQLQHSGNLDATFPALSLFDLTYKDGDLNAASQTPPSPTITVSGCNDAPVANAGADQAIALSGSPTTSVSLDGTGSSDADPEDTLTYSWSLGGTEIASGATPSVTLGLGTHLITLTVGDGHLTDTDDVVVTVTDPTPPSITPHVSGTLGDNGWYTSNVGVSWTVVDAESPAATSGCDPSSVTADTAGASFTCSATSGGGSASETVTVKRDATAPELEFSGNAGTYGITDTVNITCSATDATSGIAAATCPGASGPATDFLGSNTLSASATDDAGNTATASTTFTVVVTAADLCELTEQYVEHHGVAHALCVKLEHDSIGAYVNHVNAQRGKRLTNAEADLLISLARLV